MQTSASDRITVMILATGLLLVSACVVPFVNHSVLGCYTLEPLGWTSEHARVSTVPNLPILIQVDSLDEHEAGNRPLLVPFEWWTQDRERLKASWGSAAVPSRGSGAPPDTTFGLAFRGWGGGVAIALRPAADGYRGEAVVYSTVPLGPPGLQVVLHRTTCPAPGTLLRGAP